MSQFHPCPLLAISFGTLLALYIFRKRFLQLTNATPMNEIRINGGASFHEAMNVWD